MSNYVKPQNPIYNRKTDTYIYPLTTASQIIMDESGNRLSVEGIKNIVTPDNIGALSMELLWENASPTSAFAAQNIDLDLSEFQFIAVVTNYSTEYIRVGKGSANPVIVNTPSGKFTVYRRNMTATTTGVNFFDAFAYLPSSTTNTVSNEFYIPLEIYGIKGAKEEAT